VLDCVDDCMAAAALRQGALGDADFYSAGTDGSTGNLSSSSSASSASSSSSSIPSSESASASSSLSFSSSLAFEPAPLDLFARGILCLQLGRFDECREAWVAMGTEALEVCMHSFSRRPGFSSHNG
jgi:hypothetical protein